MRRTLEVPGAKLSLYALGLLIALASGVFILDPPNLSRDERAPTAPAPASESAADQAHAVFTPARARTAPGLGLIVPVSGITTAQLTDTWGAARSEGRSHQGIDIMAPAGSLVLAAADGRIEKFFDSARGGITIYQFDEEERYVFYYAHLSLRAANLREGDIVRQGDVIGYVGMTGNATTPHLHFEIQRMTPEKKWWEATAVNPYQFLIAGLAP